MLHKFLNPLASVERLSLVVGLSGAENVQGVYMERKQEENLHNNTRHCALIDEIHEAQVEMNGHDKHWNNGVKVLKTQGKIL